MQNFRNRLMTRVLTLLGFSSPLALLACYGTPTTDYPSEAYAEVNELSAHAGDSTGITIVAEGAWEIVSVPDFATVSQDSGVGTTWVTLKTVSENLDSASREGAIVVRDATGEQTIDILQLPASASVEEPGV